ncbi:MAG: branched-chain amino acid ABC transporter permease [Burkholderiaceae bacterium]|nr:branched-chain amino acid ABC transporter permease [Burkholderiaceae bacterium]
MRILLAPFKRLWAQLRHEVFVLPSRSFVLAGAIVLVLLPLAWGDAYVLRIVTMTAIFAIFAASWDLLSGFSGQINFGHALFFGVGAYTTALLSHHFGLPPWLTMPIGAVAAMASGVLVGIPCLRLRGSYLSLATLAFPLILIGILFAFPDFSGGELGISGLQRVVISPVANYYVAVVLMMVLCMVMWKIGTSRTGLIFHAIREDEVACRASGINTPRYKLMAFALSGLFAGIAGALFAHFLRVAGPSSLEVALSFQAVIWGIFGGAATIYGPVVAVFALYPLTEVLANFELFREIRTLTSAVIILLVLLFMPQGLAPWIRDKIEKVCPRCKARNVFSRHQCRLCSAELD